jgi:RNA polymerase-binding transcription factor DksA
MAKKVASKKVPAAKPVASKKETVTKKAPPAEKAAPAKKAAPVKKAPPAKKAAPVKKAAPAKAPAKAKTPAPAAKKAAPVKPAPVEKKKATTAPKNSPAKPAAAKSAAPAEPTAAKKAEAPAKPVSVKSSKPAPKPVTPVKPPLKKRIVVKRRPVFSHLAPPSPLNHSSQSKEKPKKLSPSFLKTQRQKLLDLRDTLLDQMSGVARDSLGSKEGGDSSAFGMHQADAGSDSYDRDFALSILSQEQNALYEIDEAILRIDAGEYGICQGSGEAIPIARLEAMPFARCTVDYQEKLDLEQASGSHRAPVTSLFGLEEKEVSKPSDDEED